MAPQKFIENVCSVPVNHSFVFSKSVIPTRTISKALLSLDSKASFYAQKLMGF
jgi:hypothetical protein